MLIAWRYGFVGASFAGTWEPDFARHLGLVSDQA
jgi:hypothetical protein